MGMGGSVSDIPFGILNEIIHTYMKKLLDGTPSAHRPMRMNHIKNFNSQDDINVFMSFGGSFYRDMETI